MAVILLLLQIVFQISGGFFDGLGVPLGRWTPNGRDPQVENHPVRASLLKGKDSYWGQPGKLTGCSYLFHLLI